MYSDSSSSNKDCGAGAHTISQRNRHMPTRKAHARWEGSLKEDKGQVDFGNGAFKAPYAFTSRTNPEELLDAAHASCFAMAGL